MGFGEKGTKRSNFRLALNKASSFFLSNQMHMHLPMLPGDKMKSMDPAARVKVGTGQQANRLPPPKNHPQK